MPTTTTISGAELRERRYAAGLTQEELAILMRYAQPTISMVETGAIKASSGVADAVERVLPGK